MSRPFASVVALAAVCLTGCAMGGAPAARSSSAFAHSDDEKSQITALDVKILDYRKSLRLAPRPDARLIQQMHGRPVIMPPTGVHTGDACADVCDLADSICKAQEDICRMSDQLGDDEWAKGKCDSAKASCTEAKKRCVECIPPAAKTRAAVAKN